MKPLTARKALPLAAAAVFATGLGAAGWHFLGDYLAGVLLFNGREKHAWQRAQPVECSAWLRTDGYANADMTCEETLHYPSDRRTALTTSGRRSHYLVYNQATSKILKEPTQDNAIWLHFHGLNGNHLHGARYLGAAARLGFTLVAAEYVNHGLSDHDGKGAAYGCKEAEDIIAVTKNVIAQFPNSPILMSASSMGTMAVALAESQLATIDPKGQLKALALENPVTTVRAIASVSDIGQHLPAALISLALRHATRLSGYDFDECSPLEAYKGFTHPTLVQHSVEDELTPVAMGHEVFEVLPQSTIRHLRIYPNGSHSAVWNSNRESFEADIGFIFAEGMRKRPMQPGNNTAVQYKKETALPAHAESAVANQR
jgi:pimeloyl-ACP methyl ester carboxylesterase